MVVVRKPTLVAAFASRAHAARRTVTPTRALLVAALVAVPVVLAGWSGVLSGEPPLLVVSAPKESSGMTLFLKADERLLGANAQAEYEIRYGERIVYPPGGSGAVFTVPKDGAATTFVPFDKFVVGNGDYDVLVRYDEHETRTSVPVEKWVSYVYLHPFDRGSYVQVDVQLSRTTGGLPNDRVLTKGELVLEIRYRGEDGKQDRVVGPAVKVETEASESFTRFNIPRERFSEGSGYYSLEPVFHNYHARGNLWVGKDPTMAQRSPPWNWVYIR